MADDLPPIGTRFTMRADGEFRDGKILIGKYLAGLAYTVTKRNRGFAAAAIAAGTAVPGDVQAGGKNVLVAGDGRASGTANTGG